MLETIFLFFQIDVTFKIIIIFGILYPYFYFYLMAILQIT
jgi:hypothetical protein